MRLRCDPARLLSDLIACAQGQHLSNGHTRLLLACFPRSGSTFLAAILANLPGFQKVSLVAGYGRREQELSLEWLLATHQACGNYVAQHHVRYSDETHRLLDLFSLQPVVLVRNIFDVVVSIRDYLKTGGVVMAQAFVPPDLPHWKDEQIDRFAADMLMPWYLNFYASWCGCPGRIQITYETLLANPVAAVAQICAAAGLRVTDDDIAGALAAARANPASIRFNVGISGRGKTLSPEVLQRIFHLAEYYPGLDLSPIGLHSDKSGAVSKLSAEFTRAYP